VAAVSTDLFARVQFYNSDNPKAHVAKQCTNCNGYLFRKRLVSNKLLAHCLYPHHSLAHYVQQLFSIDSVAKQFLYLMDRPTSVRVWM